MIPAEVRGGSFIMLSKSVGAPAYSAALQWHQLRTPISVTFAVVFGTTLALLDSLYFKIYPFSIEAPSVIASILLIMDKGTSESFYLVTFYKTLASVGGVSTGMVLSLLEEQLAGTYKDASNRRLIHEDDWKIIVFRICTLVPAIFTCLILIKRFKAITYPMVVFMVQIPSGLFAKSVGAAAGSTFSAFIAVCIAAISLVVFDNISTETLVRKSHGKAVDGIFSVLEIALEANPELSTHFTSYSEQVHKSITALEVSVATHTEWRAVTCRSVPAENNHTSLIQPLRPLFYEAFSLYWANVESYKAAEFKAHILFCNSDEVFENYFKPLLANISLAVSGIKLELEEFFAKGYTTREDTQAMLERLIEDQLWNGMVLAQQHMRAAYTEYRDECFGTFVQRWNVTDFFRQLSMMTLALVEYLRALSVVYLNIDPESHHISQQFNQLSEAVDLMRKAEHVTLRRRISSTMDRNNHDFDQPLSESTDKRSILRLNSKGGL